MRTKAGWTMLLFGVGTLAGGLCGLVAPGLLARFFGLAEKDPHYFLLPTSVAATAMGVYYVLAALKDVRPFFAWTVPMRVLNAAVFTGFTLAGSFPPAFILLGAWELSGAALTGVALWLDRR